MKHASTNSMKFVWCLLVIYHLKHTKRRLHMHIIALNPNLRLTTRCGWNATTSRQHGFATCLIICQLDNSLSRISSTIWLTNLRFCPPCCCTLCSMCYCTTLTSCIFLVVLSRYHHSWKLKIMKSMKWRTYWLGLHMGVYNQNL